MALQTHCIACGRPFTTPVLQNTGLLCTTCSRQGLFRKKIIITGITRMNQGNICVSGIDPDTWKFIRPVFPGLSRDFTMEGTTQVIRHFNMVEIEFTRYRPDQIHHTEDWQVNENFAPRFVKHLTDQEIIQVLNRMAVTDLESAINPQDKSLFIVKTQRISHIWDEMSFGKFKVRVNFTDQAGKVYTGIPVTDLLTLAYVRYQLNRNNRNYATEIMNIFNNNPYRYVRIGLTRQFQGQYWKQVTALITVPDLFNNRSFSYFENQIGGQV